MALPWMMSTPLNLAPIRVPFLPFRIGSILPYSINGPFKSSLMALFRLAWSNKVQLPLLITIAFMAFDIRLQLEINIFWEPNHARLNRRMDEGAEAAVVPMRMYAPFAAEETTSSDEESDSYQDTDEEELEDERKRKRNRQQRPEDDDDDEDYLEDTDEDGDDPNHEDDEDSAQGHADSNGGADDHDFSRDRDGRGHDTYDDDDDDDNHRPIIVELELHQRRMNLFCLDPTKVVQRRLQYTSAMMTIDE